MIFANQQILFPGRPWTFLPVLGLLLYSCSASRQPPAPASTVPAISGKVFSFINDPEGPEGPPLRPEAEYKQVVARGVYDRLIEARGMRGDVPAFRMDRGEGYVARMRYDRREVTLEEKAYDVCTTFPDSLSAMAMLLGHEITHYYEKHDWVRQFSSDYAGQLAVNTSLGALDERARNETQADYLGGFLAYAAGFEPYYLMEEFLDRVYGGYGLDPQLKGYPSLTDRKALARVAAGKMKEMVSVFDMANLLVAMGNYDLARTYFQYILEQRFESREIFNNIGVLAFLEALQYFDPKELPLAFPVELDLESRMKGARGEEDEAARAERERLLRYAIGNFERAAMLDDQYAPAFLNRGCAHALLGEYRQADFYGAEAEDRAKAQKQDKILSDVYTLYGVINYLRSSDKDAAIQEFDRAIALGGVLAAKNKAVLQPSSAAPAATGAEDEESIVEEDIDDVRLATFVRRRDALQNVNRTVITQTTQLATKEVQEGHSSILMHVELRGAFPEVTTACQVTGPGYEGTTARGIKKGDDQLTVMDQAHYGEPKTTIETPSGRVLTYEGIFFFIDQDGKVKGWGTFYRR